ncbi:MAG TPA: hypothetical protein VMW10_07205 [Alphaproteobacteria bacterium]|nr:hypothetical protein [Alphaproteobacteria bacterium]
MDLTMLRDLSIMAGAAFVQNMAFTWSSRSRNSGDPAYHRFAAWASNGIYMICYCTVLNQLLPALVNKEWWKVIVTMIVYTLATAEGSVLMMKLLLKKEKGKHRVGAR